ncbi:MAG: M56 family metallopeptidase [Planctomycetes bacterium]|nr:M56 family metallopeptidase [Planctomycetota bacterium]
MALVLGQIVCTCRFRRRLRTTFRAPPSVQRVVAACASELGLRKAPQTVMTDDPVSPMVWCGWGRRLILPARLWADLDKVGRQAVVYHELAHLRRRDHWVCWIESLIGLIYWWNPLVWLIRRRLHIEADHSCDAWVTWLMPRGRRSYAEALVRTREYVTMNYPAAPVLGIGVLNGRARHFARRLTMVMTESKRPRVSANGIALGLSLAVVAWIALPAQSCPPAKQKDKTVSAPCVSGPVVATAPTAASAPWAAIAPTAAVAPAAISGLSSFEAHLAQKEQASARRGNAVVAGDGCSCCKSGDCQSCVQAITAGTKAPSACCSSLGAKASSFSKATRLITRAAEGFAPLISGVRVGRGGGSPVAFVPPGPAVPMLFAWGAGSDGGETVTRSYKLPDGKLDALTELMVRQDVPILVSPRSDRLDVDATPAQHEVFARFVNMINAKVRQESYRLPEGKLKALTALMVRSDVPIWVVPGCEDIKVKGDNNDQDTFAAFVNLIDPGNDGRSEGRSRRGARDLFERDVRERAERGDSWRREVESRARAEADRARSRIRGLADEVRIRTRASSARVRDLQREAEMIREQAEALEEQAEALEEAAERLRERVESIEEEAEDLEEEAEDEERSDTAVRAFERRVATMRKLAETLGEHADSLSNSSASLYAESDQRNTAAVDAETRAQALYIEADGLRYQARDLEEQLYNLDETVSILRAAAESQLYARYATSGQYRTTEPALASALARADALHAVADGFQAPASTRQALIAAVESLRKHNPAAVKVTVRAATQCLRAEAPEAVAEAFRVASESLIEEGSPALSTTLLEVANTLDDQGAQAHDAAIEALSQWLEDKAAPVVADVLMALANGLGDDTPPTVTDFLEEPVEPGVR